MREILGRLPDELFEVVIFGNDVILEKDVSEWPEVECLIAFYSSHFPMEKVLSYVKLRQPFLVNDLEMQIKLQDRRRVYEVLIASGIDVPRHVYLERDDPEKVNTVEEFDDYIVVNGVHINKPLVVSKVCRFITS